jgi:glycerol-3-phosphate acyltransferase PlsX
LIRIAVDAMGGDNAPEAVVHGGIEAARFSKGEYEIVFVGDQEIIKKEIAHHFRTDDLAISIEHAPETIGMDESPAVAVKRKKASSIVVAIRIQKEGKVDAVVSAGNTGAVITSALLGLKRIEGIRRPAIGSILPNEKGRTLLIDAGANVDSKPINLLQFGIMGSIFYSTVFDVATPRVGLLSVGHEAVKGNELTLQAHQLLKKSPLNFVGNIEGGDIMRGTVDVVVCDGFVGNALLKFGESLHKVFRSNLRRQIGKRLFSQIGAFLMTPSLDGLRKMFDYQEYGGAPLLGVQGVCIVAHGRSTPRAIKSAIREARRAVEGRVTQLIRKQINAFYGTKYET